MTWSCEFCDFEAWLEDDMRLHEEKNHSECESCNRMFVHVAALRQHCLASPRHNYCGICNLDFQSPAALRGHQETHRPRSIKCSRCGRGFASASAIAKHVEQAKCFELTHSQIVKKVRDWEVRSGNPNLLTVPRIGYSDNNGPSDGPVTATAAAYNGHAFECYFCQREFRSLVSLNQHLNSGVHYSKEFKCKKCGFISTWLSGLIAHIESEKCGFMTRSQVQDIAGPVAQLRITK